MFEISKGFCWIFLKGESKRYDFKHITSKVDLDHIHLILPVPLKMGPILTPSKLKGYTSKGLFILMPQFRVAYPRGQFLCYF
ncbi:transposase [Candidatus Woesearchaeota archaeon]|nr:transposase [Candidatus Woesearchaeota archaeon]